MNIKILDCTFRDGGYYNKWDFETLLVQKYLHAINESNIDIIELGFRNFPHDQFLGAFAYTTDYNASIINNIEFYGCNNIDLKVYKNYIEDFKVFKP
jgi:4-hydroxy 2-oxovalerate aldolase